MVQNKVEAAYARSDLFERRRNRSVAISTRSSVVAVGTRTTLRLKHRRLR